MARCIYDVLIGCRNGAIAHSSVILKRIFPFPAFENSFIFCGFPKNEEKKTLTLKASHYQQVSFSKQ